MLMTILIFVCTTAIGIHKNYKGLRIWHLSVVAETQANKTGEGKQGGMGQHRERSHTSRLTVAEGVAGVRTTMKLEEEPARKISISNYQ